MASLQHIHCDYYYVFTSELIHLYDANNVIESRSQNIIYTAASRSNYSRERIHNRWQSIAHIYNTTDACVWVCVTQKTHNSTPLVMKFRKFSR